MDADEGVLGSGALDDGGVALAVVECRGEVCVHVDEPGEDRLALESRSLIGGALDGDDAVVLDHDSMVLQHLPLDRVEHPVGYQDLACHQRNQSTPPSLQHQWHRCGVATVPDVCQHGTMNLTTYVERLQEQLTVAAGASGDETRELAGRLTASLDSATRLVLLEALSAAADEITREMAPGTVEVRLRQGEPEFVVVAPPSEVEFSDVGTGATSPRLEAAETDDGGTARLNLRLPETLKRRIEDAAGVEGLSLNAWLVRAAGAALDALGSRRSPTGGDRYTGWVR